MSYDRYYITSRHFGMMTSMQVCIVYYFLTQLYVRIKGTDAKSKW